MAQMQRVDIGFQGGQILAVRADPESHEALTKALGDSNGDRWQTLQTDDASILVDLSQVVYVRLETDDQKVGF